MLTKNKLMTGVDSDYPQVKAIHCVCWAVSRRCNKGCHQHTSLWNLHHSGIHAITSHKTKQNWK